MKWYFFKVLIFYAKPYNINSGEFFNLKGHVVIPKASNKKCNEA